MSERKEIDEAFDQKIFEEGLRSACAEAKAARAGHGPKIMLNECESFCAAFRAAIKQYPDSIVEILDVAMQFTIYSILDSDLAPEGSTKFQEIVLETGKQAGVRWQFASV